ncbi:MAG: DUF2332 domain-containing protein [Thermoleophilia bacterium]|nr:DUF2332 domain-containing protein [Thermoleophilia bacterium]
MGRARHVGRGGEPQDEQREAFLWQAGHCEGRSQLYAELCRRFAGDPRVGALADGWEGRVPLQILGGLNYLVLGGEASWDDVDAALDEHGEFLRRFVAEQPVQTNEVQRSWVLLPLFLHAVGSADLHVVELGASAGLNLLWDRYRYRYEAGSWGPEDAPLELGGEERGRLPAGPLAERPRVRSRVGIDRAPVDAASEEGARLLRAFVWVGQQERLARLDRALEALRAEPPPLVRADAAEELPNVLAGLPGDGIVLVFQTSLFEYLAEDARERIRETIDTAERDLVFVASGRPRGVPRAWGMRIYRPGGRREFVGHADYHGTWLDYEL